MLIEAKRKVHHGHWLNWLAANCDVPKRTAAHYMALARSRKELCDQIGNVLPISVEDDHHLLHRARREIRDRFRAVPISKKIGLSNKTGWHGGFLVEATSEVSKRTNKQTTT